MAIRFAQATDVGYTGNPARELARSQNVLIAGFLLLHIPLAYFLSLSPWISTIHAVIVVLLAIRAALRQDFPQVLMILAYVGGAEVLWRMTEAHLLWEHGKYVMIAVAAMALAVEWRSKVLPRRIRTALPLILLVVLLPGIIPSFIQLGFSEGRDQVSFNLSGHVALAVLALYMWARPVNRPLAIKTMLALMAPIVGVAFLAFYNTLIAELTFLDASNFATSGGYGPNQVSNLLGLGALMGIIVVILLPKASGARFVIIALVMGIIAQNFLTFSRGGIYSLVLALLAFGFHLTRTPQARRRFILLLIGGLAIAAIGIFPSLNDFTGGSLGVRFTDLDTTGRLEAAEADIQAFEENPLTGVGVGLATAYRLTYFTELVAAHTEFTRLLAEHGLFGLVAVCILIVMLLVRYRATPPGFNRALVAAFAVWPTSIMMQSAMRFGAISFIFALALVGWEVQRASNSMLIRGHWLKNRALAPQTAVGSSGVTPISAIVRGDAPDNTPTAGSGFGSHNGKSNGHSNGHSNGNGSANGFAHGNDFFNE